MNVISYGGGTNSTAMLIGMYHKNIPADSFSLRIQAASSPTPMSTCPSWTSG